MSHRLKATQGLTPLEAKRFVVSCRGKYSRKTASKNFANQSKPLTGFTLIEILVAVAVLSIILLIVAGIFGRFVDSQRRIVGEQTIQEDLHFTLELFNRETRLSYGESYTTRTPDWLIMRNQNGVCVSYRLEDNSLERAEAPDSQTTNDSCLNATYDEFTTVTTNKTFIENLEFLVQPANENTQGFITLIMTAHAKGKAESPLAFQSTVTSRQVATYEPSE